MLACGEGLKHNMGFLLILTLKRFFLLRYGTVLCSSIGLGPGEGGAGAADITDYPYQFFFSSLVGIVALLSFAFAFHLPVSPLVRLDLLQHTNSSRKAPGGKFFFCLFYSFCSYLSLLLLVMGFLDFWSGF